ncbi:hypothetical protein TRVL_07388 [Trypanosoma vivax]|uniref:Uncharacterized protein n=1 Tax=Trypanosoma vivax (strain Y486) TaxID=1055687 RepID=G0U8I8_TRYVY|nr:hypothetical protein TRVL_07388 [Trypanosoma vivax]CCC53914.1 hypothetical protein TVY486_1113980 [Trypanosoma vivax Y486]
MAYLQPLHTLPVSWALCRVPPRDCYASVNARCSLTTRPLSLTPTDCAAARFTTLRLASYSAALLRLQLRRPRGGQRRGLASTPIVCMGHRILFIPFPYPFSLSRWGCVAGESDSKPGWAKQTTTGQVAHTSRRVVCPSTPF